MIIRLRFLLASMIAAAYGSVSAQPASDAAIPVSVVAVTPAAVSEELPLTGSVTARRVSYLSPRVAGTVERVLVDAGDEVPEGAPLLELDTKLARIELARVDAQLAEAQTRLEDAERLRDEAAALVEEKHVAQTSYKAAVAAVTIETAIVQRLRAERDRQQELLERHTVYAPFAGAIASKQVEVGQWVRFETTLFELAELDALRVEVPVPQGHFRRVDVGAPVRIELEALPQRTFRGRVGRKVPVGGESTRMFPILIDLRNDERLIAPGMSARVFLRLSLPEADRAVLVPRDALVQRPGGSTVVWVVRERGDAPIGQAVSVEVGLANGDNVVIAAGEIRPGDRVVVRGNELLRPGQPLDVTETLELKP